MSFEVGALVRARQREWVVLPESDGEMLVLRPLGGSDDEVTGIYLPLETVEPARFELPDPQKVGDARSCRLLRDAVRLGFRNSTGPFRSFGNIAVEPRPYQLVPLLMALKLDPVRLLIADDVGIGKTVEAMLVARELLDRGEVEKLAVLCPPQLAEQWQDELREKFHLDAQLVLPSTVSKLERRCRFGESVFDHFDCTVVSTDFIKQESRRADFLRAAPPLLIVDEAHTCVEASGPGGSHQRFKLVSGLARDQERHLILVTATPHSGNEGAFRSLLGLLRADFTDLPDDLTGAEHQAERRRIAQHFVQRKRVDIERYLGEKTTFPQRLTPVEATYLLTPEYKKLFERALAYARDAYEETSSQSQHRQRVRWWSLLALLRSLASSPAAAAATLRSRAASAETTSAKEADEIGRRSVLDLADDESPEGMDVVHGSDDAEEGEGGTKDRRRLLEMARQAEALQGDGDAKLASAVKIVRKLLSDGFRPIVFCRFIPTADYVADELRKALRGVEVASVTGTLPHAAREEHIAELAAAGEKRVLVCTDCLSEGVNLQDHFDAVMHYDLSWNPTRHEQREGRVDRFGQARKTVRVVTYWGEDNQIDGIVLDVLIRKHEAIRTALGISVPVPITGDAVVQAVFEGLLLREGAGHVQERLEGFDDLLSDRKRDLDLEWDAVSAREKRSRTMFAQESLKPDEVVAQLEAVREAIGTSTDVSRFVGDALRMYGAVVDGEAPTKLDLKAVPLALKDAVRTQSADGFKERLAARFELPVQEGEAYLSRTSPFVNGLATFVTDAALDATDERSASRCGAIRTRQVERKTTVLLVRFRFRIVTKRQGRPPLEKLAEDCRVLGFVGGLDSPEWLSADALEPLLAAAPDANLSREHATEEVGRVVGAAGALAAHLAKVAQLRAGELLETHRRVRSEAQQRGVSHEVAPQGEPDLLGIYVYLPVPTLSSTPGGAS